MRGVSIHAPAGGATVMSMESVKYYMFQSTRPQGARHQLKALVFNPIPFQSTRPQGARPQAAQAIMQDYLFQSTRPQGARLHHPIRLSRSIAVSIHAPAGGATLAQSAMVFGNRSFNPRARRGRDRLLAKTETAYRKTVFCANPCQLDHR